MTKRDEILPKSAGNDIVYKLLFSFLIPNFEKLTTWNLTFAVGHRRHSKPLYFCLYI